MPPDLFFFDHGMATLDNPSRRTREAWERAKTVCRACPVRVACARDSLGEVEGVWGGYDPAQRRALRLRHSHTVRAMQGPKKREYATFVAQLHDRTGMPWKEIARVVGLTHATVLHLYAWYQDAQKEAAEGLEDLKPEPVPRLRKESHGATRASPGQHKAAG